MILAEQLLKTNQGVTYRAKVRVGQPDCACTIGKKRLVFETIGADLPLHMSSNMPVENGRERGVTLQTYAAPASYYLTWNQMLLDCESLMYYIILQVN